MWAIPKCPSTGGEGKKCHVNVCVCVQYDMFSPTTPTT